MVIYVRVTSQPELERFSQSGNLHQVYTHATSYLVEYIFIQIFSLRLYKRRDGPTLHRQPLFSLVYSGKGNEKKDNAFNEALAPQQRGQ